MSALGKAVRRVLGAPTLLRVRHRRGLNILVVGVYLRDKPNLAPSIAAAVKSRRHTVTQAWAAVGAGDHGVSDMCSHTRRWYERPTPKFTIVNELLGLYDVSRYTHIVVTDDDVELPPRFIDDLLGLQDHYGFALCQPARSGASNIDHPVTLESHARMARQTNFVEIGPLFSMASKAFPVLLPFDESFYMGWGLDHVWPGKLAEVGLTMGIIDWAPVHHRFRPVASTYSFDAALSSMADKLAGQQRIREDDRRFSVRSYWV